MSIIHRLPIKAKFTLIIFISNLVLLFIIFSIVIAWDIKSIKDTTRLHAELVSSAFNQDFVKIMLFDSPNLAADVVSRMRVIPEIKNAVIYNGEKQPVFHYNQNNLQQMVVPTEIIRGSYFEDNYLHLFAPLIYEGQNFGTVYIRSSTDLLAARLENYKYFIALFVIATLVISFLLSYLAQLFFSTPIIRLANILDKVASDRDMAIRAQTNESNEIGRLYDNYNKMINVLEEQHHQLQISNKELSEHKARLEYLVQERTSEIRDYAKELESFSYSVSHDLRAPLRSINGFSTILLEDYANHLDDNARGYLDRIMHTTNHMGELIDDLLQLSKINRHKLNKQYIDLSNLAYEIMEEQLASSNYGKQFKMEVDPGMSLTADPVLMRVVMNNLISNAIKYSNHSNQPSIKIGSMKKDEEEAIFIEDNGAGFDMKFSNKLFKPFERLHDSSQYEGTGIGLATVKRIVERHGGKIWADGVVGKGAVFYFSIPDRL